jgi:hypothetical protein
MEIPTALIISVVVSLVGALGTLVVAILSKSIGRNVEAIDEQMKVMATDVRRLAETGARHGESLAAGVQQFKAIEKRLDKLEAWKDKTLQEEEP